MRKHCLLLLIANWFNGFGFYRQQNREAGIARLTRAFNHAVVLCNKGLRQS
jgi:hypothetical protein